VISPDRKVGRVDDEVVVAVGGMFLHRSSRIRRAEGALPREHVMTVDDVVAVVVAGDRPAETRNPRLLISCRIGPVTDDRAAVGGDAGRREQSPPGQLVSQA
jgi:hypothetical protein